MGVGAGEEGCIPRPGSTPGRSTGGEVIGVIPAALQAMGCTLAQGFFMGEPTAADAVEALLVGPPADGAEATPGTGATFD